MSVSEPGKIITPWAESGLKNPIPPAANPATGRAGFDQGFSAINMTAKEAGGIPPFGQDFNGIFYEVTNILRYMQAGGQPTFSSALATSIGGYPKGAMVLGSDGVTLWQSKVDSNSTDPNTDPTDWGTFDIGLKADLAAPDGADLIGFGNTTVERVLNSEVFIDYFAPVLDYGPILNTAQQTGALGGTIKLRGERYPVLTSITRRAGWTIEGVGPYATELAWGGGADPMIKNEQVALQSRSGKIIGNNSGQYHTSLKDLALIGNGLGVGLLRGDGWWDRMVRVIIEGFDVGEQDGLGTSNVTGCYWCRNEQVWYRNNRVNLRVTDYTNLNTWANCRFSGAADWDIEFIEPTNPLTLGMQGNAFVDCEFASPDSVFLGARIFDLNFHNPYFEQNGYAVYDGTSHTKGTVTFTGTPKFFGRGSTKNKVVAGYNGGNCQNWSFQNMKTNLGKGAGAPSTMQVIDMGPTANYFSAYHPVLTGVPGWELTQQGNLSKLKMQLYDVNGKSVLQMKSLSTELTVTNVHHTVVDYTLTSNIGVDLFEKGVDVGELTTEWFTVMEVPDFSVEFAHAACHYELTIGGRNPATGNAKAAFIGGEVYGANNTIGVPVEVFNRQMGSNQITVEQQAIRSGTSLLVQIRKSAASTATFDQVYCAVESKTAGKFTELAI